MKLIFNTIDEKYYDYDYKTSSVNGDDVIDTTKTGTSYYDDFLNEKDLKYMQQAKNLDGKIVYMTPNEYYKRCVRDIFGSINVDFDSLVRQRNNREQIEELKDIILKDKKKFTLPFLNYANKSQEGLHRMLALAEIYGWYNKEFPVLVVDWYDLDVKFKWDCYEKERLLFDVMYETLRYKYGDMEDFNEELQYVLNDKLEWEPDYRNTIKFGDDVPYTLDDKGDKLVLTVDFTVDKKKVPISYEFFKDKINFVEKEGEDELSDDILLDDEDDLL